MRKMWGKVWKQTREKGKEAWGAAEVNKGKVEREIKGEREREREGERERER